MPRYSKRRDDASPLDEEEDEDDRGTTTTRPPPHVAVSGAVDDDTLRIMLSTDNHLGYAERDPVRGMDSFAAFEEVLYLAKKFHCDMVLIAGDLFHENRPTRHTLYKTMDILRRYCMGQNPVKIQILSDPSKTFRSQTLNYLEENVSVDLPVLSIHGNHDDPTRDVSGETLAALDLLSVTSLVNYFGRQELIDQVEVAPVLVQKGRTQAAIYGLGSMRDERLNRMWNQGKVRFLKPDHRGGHGDDDDDDDHNNAADSSSWFNIFALHQNRDVGRGSKNCVREDMIPEWMDVVMWGHEHECQIEFQESVTGTFRITQPGSSVATSLVPGEAVRKKVGLLDIRKDDDGSNQFRLSPLPLTQVRGFVTTELCLRDHRARLDPEDPKVDAKITAVLEEEVRLMIRNAREKVQDVAELARHVLSAVAAEDDGDDDDNDDNGFNIASKIKYKLHKPDEVLVRIKVDHSGFSSLSNQRFGSRFVGEVANPGDTLLFSRRKDPSAKSSASASSAAGSRSARMLSTLRGAVPPDETAPATVEDLVMGQLEAPERKMQLLDKIALSEAVVEFTEKHTVSAIPDAAVKMIRKKQKELIKRTREGDEVIEKGSQVRDILDAESQLKDEAALRAKEKRGKRQREVEDDDDDDDSDDDRERNNGGRRRGKENAPVMDDDMDEDDEEEVEVVAPRKSNAAGRSKASNRTAASASDNSQRKAARREQYLDGSDVDDEDDDEVMEMPAPKATAAKSRSRKEPASASRSKRARPAAKRPNYADDDDDDMVEDGQDSDAYVARRGGDSDNDDDLEFDEDEDEEPRNKRGKAAAKPRGGRAGGGGAAASAKKGGAAASSRPRTTSGSTQPRKTAAGAASRVFDDDSDEDGAANRQRAGKSKRAMDDDMDDDWGTAATRSQF